jgi:hypothetical protein
VPVAYTTCRWGSEQVDLTVWILKLTLLYLINYDRDRDRDEIQKSPRLSPFLPTDLFRAPLHEVLPQPSPPGTPCDGVRRNPRYGFPIIREYRLCLTPTKCHPFPAWAHLDFHWCHWEGAFPSL